MSCWMPFVYFYRSRLAKGSLAFHFFFEWVSAVLALWSCNGHRLASALGVFLGAYLAFISIYEVGYLMNDYWAVHREKDPRRRGPEASPLLVVGWALARVAYFCALTLLLGQAGNRLWWIFYLSLMAIFLFHNLTTRLEFKTITFSWLASFRFCAPSLFFIPAVNCPGLWLSAVLLYSAFRQPAYLASKDLLQLPGRSSRSYRLLFFGCALPLQFMLSNAGGASIFCLHARYFFGLALVNALVPHWLAVGSAQAKAGKAFPPTEIEVPPPPGRGGPE